MNGQAPESLPRRQTDPLWIQDHFLAGGHDENTPNATATFVKRKGRHYLVTCRHVLEIVSKRRTAGGERQLTMALEIDGTVLNLSRVSAQGVVLNVRTPEARMHSERADIALAPLDESNWKRLSERKNKEAIDLDSWREPNWSVVRHCLAVGYENEGKEADSQWRFREGRDPNAGNDGGAGVSRAGARYEQVRPLERTPFPSWVRLQRHERRRRLCDRGERRGHDG